MSAAVNGIGSWIGLSGNPVITVARPVPVGGVVVVFGHGNQTLTATVTDARGNVYDVIPTGSSPSPIIAGYMAVSVVKTALQIGDTITPLPSSGKNRQAVVACSVTGLTASPLDKTGAATGNTASAAPGTTGTLSSDNEVLIVGVGAVQTTDPSTFTGYTKVNSAVSNGGTNDRVAALYFKELASTLSQSPSAALGAITTWCAGYVTLKVAADAPGDSGGGSAIAVTVLDEDGTTRLAAVLKGVWDGASTMPLSTLTTS